MDLHLQRSLACVKPSQAVPKIVNGNVVTEPAVTYPFLVMISTYPTENYKSSLEDVTLYGLCGGTLVSPGVVLTAGHCKGMGPSGIGKQMVIIMNWYDCKNDLRSQMYNVTKIVRHPDYDLTKNSDEWSLYYDVMLLTFDEEDLLKTNFQLATLDDGSVLSSLQEGDELLIPGWGLTETGGVASQLLETTVTYLPYPDCLQKIGNTGKIDESNICATLDNNSGPCSGDSGGPVLHFDAQTGKKTQIGLVSWGNKCGAPSHAAVFANISQVYEWVTDTIVELRNGVTYAPVSPSKTHTPSNHPTTETAIISSLSPSNKITTPLPSSYGTTTSSTYMPSLKPTDSNNIYINPSFVPSKYYEHKTTMSPSDYYRTTIVPSSLEEQSSSTRENSYCHHHHHHHHHILFTIITIIIFFVTT